MGSSTSAPGSSSRGGPRSRPRSPTPTRSPTSWTGTTDPDHAARPPRCRMEWKQFWKVIEAAYQPSGPDHFEALKEKLGELKWFEVVAFQARFDEAMAAANTINLEGAAYLINGGE